MSASNGNRVSRRDFIKAVTAGVGSLIGMFIGVPSVAYLLSPTIQAQAEDDAHISLGQIQDYPIGIPTRFNFTRTKVNGWGRTAVNYSLYVVRINENEVHVFSDVCTHLGCHVSWHPDVEHYISPCHNGHFDVMGKNINGPPPRPLDEFGTNIEGGNLFVTLPPIKRAAK